METAIKNKQLFAWQNSEEKADIILLPFMWDVTASYKAGSSLALDAILETILSIRDV